MKARDQDEIAYVLRDLDGERNERHAQIVKGLAGCRIDVARLLLRDVGGLPGLFGLDEGALLAHGISPAGAKRIEQAKLMSREYRAFHAVQRAPISSPEQVWQLACAWCWHEDDREVFRTISLDVRTTMIGVDVVAIGGVDRVEVFPREVFRAAMRRNAAGVVFVHNHPAGDPTPSDTDVRLTERMVEVGKIVGIPVIDHIVVASRGFHSIGELGLVARLGVHDADC